MTTPGGPPPERPSRGKLVLILIATILVISVLFVGFVVFRLVRCSNLDEPLALSPDGRWAVLATTKSCPAGPLLATNDSVVVTLAPNGARSSEAPVQIFEQFDAAEPPQITWTGTNEVILKVSKVGDIRTSKREAAHISFKYVVPGWLWKRFDEIDTYRRQRDKEAEELYRAGKITSKELRIDLDINQQDAEEWARFRQWVHQNATVEPDSTVPSR